MIFQHENNVYSLGLWFWRLLVEQKKTCPWFNTSERKWMKLTIVLPKYVNETQPLSPHKNWNCVSYKDRKQCVPLNLMMWRYLLRALCTRQGDPLSNSVNLGSVCLRGCGWNKTQQTSVWLQKKTLLTVHGSHLLLRCKLRNCEAASAAFVSTVNNGQHIYALHAN
jgi:hypothetical protein